MEQKQKIRIVCFGDSNTWGYDPETKRRHGDHVRWTSVLQDLLGDDYQVVECGINGRTAAHDEPFRECRNGVKGIGYSLLESSPLDLLILNLGTNDLKYEDNPAAISRGIWLLMRTVHHSGLWNTFDTSVFRGGKERVLLMAPIHIGKELDERFPDSILRGKHELSTRFAELYEPVAKKFGAEFMDSAQYAQPSQADCLHMDAENHRRLAEAVCAKVRAMFEEPR